MTTRNHIIIAGGFLLPDGNASAIRTSGLAKLFQSLGFTPIILGKLAANPPADNAEHVQYFDGIEMRDIRKPFPSSRPRNYERTEGGIPMVLEYLGADNVEMIILYNHPVRGTWAVQREARRLGIRVVLDLTEWYGWEGRKIVRNVKRLIGSEWRMRILSRQIGKVLCASSAMKNRLDLQEALILPFVVDPSEPRWADRQATQPTPTEPRRFVYVGSPGIGMYKDCLPNIIRAFIALPPQQEFQLDIYGLTRAQFDAGVNNQAVIPDRLETTIKFHGRVPHATALDALANSHFSLFLRPDNRISNMGFPTKLMEAVTLGIPVISNATSDIAKYLRDGENGLIVPSPSIEHLAATLNAALNLSPQAYASMRQTQMDWNPFAVEHWITPMRAFLDGGKSEEILSIEGPKNDNAR